MDETDDYDPAIGVMRWILEGSVERKVPAAAVQPKVPVKKEEKDPAAAEDGDDEQPPPKVVDLKGEVVDLKAEEAEKPLLFGDLGVDHFFHDMSILCQRLAAVTPAAAADVFSPEKEKEKKDQQQSPPEKEKAAAAEDDDQHRHQHQDLYQCFWVCWLSCNLIVVLFGVCVLVNIFYWYCVNNYIDMPAVYADPDTNVITHLATPAIGIPSWWMPFITAVARTTTALGVAVQITIIVIIVVALVTQKTDTILLKIVLPYRECWSGIIQKVRRDWAEYVGRD